MAVAYIGLGSNLEDPRNQILEAFRELRELPNSELMAISSLYQSKAVGPEQPDYINAVASLNTSLSPLALLDALQAIEQAHRRIRKEHWGPRTLDLDLLAYDNQILDLPRLRVPHPYLTQRNFVVIPLEEIAPELTLATGESIRQLAQNLGKQDLTQVETFTIQQLKPISLYPTKQPPNNNSKERV